MALLRLPAALRQWIAASQSMSLSHAAGFHSKSPLQKLFDSGIELNHYPSSHPPTQLQLRYANAFFRHEPQKLWDSRSFRQLPPSPFPEVAFLGRSNVGKSSLLNALFGTARERPAKISANPGLTRSLNAYALTGIGPNELAKAGRGQAGTERWRRFPPQGILLVDTPGYGHASHREWGEDILKYLQKRKQLRRTFVLVNAEHGLKKTDVTFLTYLRQQGIIFQIVLTKIDTILFPSKTRREQPTQEEMRANVPRLQRICEETCAELNRAAGDGQRRAIDILCCSSGGQARSNARMVPLGIDHLRWAVLSACGRECDVKGQAKRPQVEALPSLDESQQRIPEERTI